VSDLTGGFETSKLPQIAKGAVTVTIARRIRPGTSADFSAWSDEMAGTVRRFPGCLGATTLHPGGDSDEYHMVFRFVDAVHLRRWERSTEREELLSRLDDLVLSERVTVTAGGDEFFALQASGTPERTEFGRFMAELAWIYPVALGLTLLVGPSLGHIPVWLRALIFTAMVGLASRLAVAPLRVRFNRRRMLPQGQRAKRR
jgi:antibiotic biosynthesis monooxygenase (ABM) superfamily enzyme